MASVTVLARGTARPQEAAPEVTRDYAGWYVELLGSVRQHRSLPIAYADYFDDDAGWEIGWGSGYRIPHPPAVGGPAEQLFLRSTADQRS